MLELSSGFSFRGLDIAKRGGYHYIDTDLPEMITMKKNIAAELTRDEAPVPGTVELLPLNALDAGQFKAIVERFPAGEIAIVNEGLLMYLDIPERKQICEIIHGVLKERGGCWITADVYVRQHVEKLGLELDQRTKDFFAQHAIEENKYDSFPEAEEFFLSQGFQCEKEAVTDLAALSTSKYFLQNLPPERIDGLKKAGKMQATWLLRAI